MTALVVAAAALMVLGPNTGLHRGPGFEPDTVSQSDTVALGLAAALRRRGDLPGAMAIYDSLVAGSSPSVRVFEEVAMFWSESGRPDSAAVILDRGSRIHVDSPELWVLLGRASEEAADTTGTVAAYRTAAGLLAGQPMVAFRLGRALALGGDPTGAARVFRTLPSLGASAATTQAATNVLMDRGAVSEAAAVIDAAALIDGTSLFEEAAQSDETARSGPVDVLLRETRARVLIAAGAELAARAEYAALSAAGHPRAVIVTLDRGWFSTAADERTALETGIRTALLQVEDGERTLISAARQPLAYGAKDLISGTDLIASWGRARLERNRADLDRLLNEVVLGREWGGELLVRLQVGYPSSVLLDRYDARRALSRGAFIEARDIIDRLLRSTSGDAALHRLRAEASEGAGRPAEALAAYAMSLELEPASLASFSALARLHTDATTLVDLLEQVRRLRVLHCDESILLEREIETLHRLGRLDEARSLATGRSPGSGSTR